MTKRDMTADMTRAMQRAAEENIGFERTFLCEFAGALCAIGKDPRSTKTEALHAKSMHRAICDVLRTELPWEDRAS